MDSREDLEKEILDKVKEYYEIVHKNREFIPGKTKLNYSGRCFDAEEMVAMTKSLLEFTLTYGKYSLMFERELAKTNSVKYGILTNSGSSANLLAVTSLTSYKLERPLKEGDEVITPLCTFPTTLNPIIQNRLVPVLADVELGTYNLNPALLEEAYSDKTRAVMVPHTLGNPNDMDKIMEFVHKHNLYLIEDCCDALDSTYDGKNMGSFGDLATFSFFPPHHITLGEGGAVITSNPLLKTIVTSFRDWGRACWCEPGKNNTCGRRFEYEVGGVKYDHKYMYDHIGYNLKALDLQAAMGLEQLKKLPSFTQKRKENFNRLYSFIKPYEKWFILPKSLEKADPSWFAFVLTVKDDAPFKKVDLVKFLESKMIETRPLFGGNILEQPGYKNSNFPHRVVGGSNVSDKILRDTFFVGVAPVIDERRMDFMIQSFKEFFISK
jgi:CDP-4-dehydro-6-deoxyglucose reductase, E1